MRQRGVRTLPNTSLPIFFGLPDICISNDKNLGVYKHKPVDNETIDYGVE